MVRRYSPLAALIIILFLSSCGGRWYQPGKTERDLFMDESTCEQTAKSAALGESFTGKRVIREAYDREYELCMIRHGWTRNPPEFKAEEAEKLESKPVAPPNLAEREDNDAFAFSGQTVRLPKGSMIVKEWTKKAGLSIMQVVSFQIIRNGKIFGGELIFQSVDTIGGFEDVIYPISPPFFTYASGKLNNGSTWRAFAGKLANGSWLGAVGTYWKTSRTERMLITFTTMLPVQNQNSPPPAGLKTTPEQNKALDELTEEFLPWLNDQGSPSFSIFKYLKWDLDRVNISPE